MSARAKREYVQAIYHPVPSGKAPDRKQILDEFCRVTGYHRKHAIRVLSTPAPGADRSRRHRAVT